MTVRLNGYLDITIYIKYTRQVLINQWPAGPDASYSCSQAKTRHRWRSCVLCGKGSSRRLEIVVCILAYQEREVSEWSHDWEHVHLDGHTQLFEKSGRILINSALQRSSFCRVSLYPYSGSTELIIQSSQRGESIYFQNNSRTGYAHSGRTLAY